MAGLLFSWSVAVMPGLALLPDNKYLAAMQAMNRAIQNPLFLACFLAPLLLLPGVSWQYYHHQRFGWLLAAAICYFAGVFVVTITGNVPINEHLDKLQLSQASVEALLSERNRIAQTWVMLNNIRTIASVLAFTLMLYACMMHTDKAGKILTTSNNFTIES
ncbi:MAG: DUF1772 domain-containing protein [Chitinophagaceae bacterium]